MKCLVSLKFYAFDIQFNAFRSGKLSTLKKTVAEQINGLVSI